MIAEPIDALPPRLRTGAAFEARELWPDARPGDILAVQDVWPGTKKGQHGPNVRSGDMFTLCAGKRRAGVIMVENEGEEEGRGRRRQGMGAGMRYRARLLTPVECERIQGLPDDHTRWGADGAELSDTQRHNLIGRAVPPPAVHAIASRLPVEAASR